MNALRVAIALAPGDLNWIGGRFASELVDRLPAHGITARVNPPASWLHDLDYSLFVYGPPIRRPAVGLFTHGETRPRLYARDYDGHLTFSSTLRGYLIDSGAPAAPAVLSYPVDPVHWKWRTEVTACGDAKPQYVSDPRRCTFGVAGRVYNDGRKGEHLVRALVDAGYNVCAWGSGWPCRTFSDKLEDLPTFYRSLDYYIDTSSDEGGCVPAAEAMAMGVPVISHTVGVSRPVIPYERHSAESLLSVVRALTTPYTYDDFACDHAEVFLATMARGIGA